MYTVTADIASDPGTPSSPNDEVTVTAGGIGSTVTISIPLMDNVVAITSTTEYLVEVPHEIPLDSVIITSATVY